MVTQGHGRDLGRLTEVAVILDHVLEDYVAVQLVWASIFVTATAMLVGPLNGEPACPGIG